MPMWACAIWKCSNKRGCLPGEAMRGTDPGLFFVESQKTLDEQWLFL